MSNSDKVCPVCYAVCFSRHTKCFRHSCGADLANWRARISEQYDEAFGKACTRVERDMKTDVDLRNEEAYIALVFH